ncbi:MAG: HlyD family efflux transporter periplasmic adaptor subunit [Burkholderiaceae bacterium]
MDPRSALLLVQTRMAGQCGRDQAAQACCEAVLRVLGATQVTLGWLDRFDVRLVAGAPTAASGLGAQRSQLVQAAMIEAVDQQTLLASTTTDPLRHIVVAQQALALAGAPRDALVVSVPLAHGQQAVGALCVQLHDEAARRAQADLPATLALLARLAPPAGHLLALEERAGRSLARRLADDLRALGTRWARSSRRLRYGAALLVAAGLLTPFEQTINSEARIEGATQNTVAAPSGGLLTAVNVRPGDLVQAGDLLASLTDRELELERSRLNSEIAQFQGEADAAMSRGQRTEMSIAQSRVEQATARRDLVDAQLAQAQVRAPMGGIVLEGDLWQAIGSPVSRGDKMFTIAPAQAYRVIIELDQQDIRHAVVGQQGTLALSALPWDHIPLTVTRIAPMARALEQRVVVEIEAQPLEAGVDLRPGLRGIVHLEGRQSSLLGRWSDRAMRAAVRLWWRWRPW